MNKINLKDYYIVVKNSDELLECKKLYLEYGLPVHKHWFDNDNPDFDDWDLVFCYYYEETLCFTWDYYRENSINFYNYIAKEMFSSLIETDLKNIKRLIKLNEIYKI